MDNAQLDLLIEELGLIPSTFITPEVKKQILLEVRQREFEPMNCLEEFYHKRYLQQLSKYKSDPKAKRVADTSEPSLFYPNGLFKSHHETDSFQSC